MGFNFSVFAIFLLFGNQLGTDGIIIIPPKHINSLFHPQVTTLNLPQPSCRRSNQPQIILETNFEFYRPWEVVTRNVIIKFRKLQAAVLSNKPVSMFVMPLYE